MRALEQWNQRFATASYVFGEEPNAYLVRHATSLQPGKTLALADGEGRNSVWLAQQGLQVEAFDFSSLAIEKARALADKKQVCVNFKCCSWEVFDWQPAQYQNVVGIFFQFANPAERALLFSKIDQTLQPGGIVIIQGYGTEQLQYKTGGPGVLENLYDETLLKDAFANYDLLDLRTYTEVIHEGEGHRGISALVGMVAQKRKG